MSMEITPAWDNSQRTYIHEGSYFVTPKLPASEGEVLVRCTDSGQHPSRELGRGRWEEVVSGNESPASLVFWGAPLTVHGRPRFVPQVRMFDHKHQDSVASKRGDAIDYAPNDFTDLNADDPGKMGPDMSMGKSEFRCPTCRRRVVLSPAKLEMYVFLDLVARNVSDGERALVDVSRLRELPAILTEKRA
ncbi:hypothetical protein [Kocuria sp. UBA5001]|uniref:hypothetical protein n=1 Tax=Kocuria sp. UBA5001 TaxID=1946674 RepID=UPI0025BFDC82|nr:hypothetical protein [Kocuria sp. UBA5001]